MNLSSTAAALQFLAIVSASVFTGAAIYINVAEQPARLLLKAYPHAMIAQWRQSYKRAARMQVTCATISSVTGILAYVAVGTRKSPPSGRGAGVKSTPWLLSSLLIGSVIPFTVVAIMPTNAILHKIEADDSNLYPTIKKWGKLHAVRSAASILALTTMVWVSIKE